MYIVYSKSRNQWFEFAPRLSRAGGHLGRESRRAINYPSPVIPTPGDIIVPACSGPWNRDNLPAGCAPVSAFSSGDWDRDNILIFGIDNGVHSVPQLYLVRAVWQNGVGDDKAGPYSIFLGRVKNNDEAARLFDAWRKENPEYNGYCSVAWHELTEDTTFLNNPIEISR